MRTIEKHSMNEARTMKSQVMEIAASVKTNGLVPGIAGNPWLLASPTSVWASTPWALFNPTQSQTLLLLDHTGVLFFGGSLRLSLRLCK